MGYIHQLAMIFPILTAVLNFAISRFFKQSKWTVLLTWIVNLTVLFSSKHFDGYPFASISSHLHFLDGFRGVFNWATCFNITFCRLISYNIDYYYACKQEQEAQVLRKKYGQNVKADWGENRKRQERILNPAHDYDFLHFIMYVFYVPLYIGGPVTGYNAFYSFVEHKQQQEVSPKELIKMGARVLLYVISLEIFLHFIYSVGFSEQRFWASDSPLLDRYYVRHIMNPMTPLQICMNGFMVLVFMYMKFLIIWRFFRLWSLSDGINPPENMVRCIINNYSISGFWRSWHRSLYYFILRYIYVPLGGSKSKTWSVWIIFLFIAVWHDLWMRWIAWAFFNCCGIILEMIVVHAVAKTRPIQAIKKMSNPSRPIYFLMVMVLGAFSLSIMIISNLAIMYGFDGTAVMLGAIFDGGSKLKLFLVLAYFFPMCTCGILMYEEREARIAHEKASK
jgi:D-alanyl-lipoteichoic acid acyltransferase DltB (MBOAT superfamily)